jgi:hypothetical protein
MQLVEVMARAAFERRHKGARNCYAWDDFWEENEYQRNHYMNEAQAALAAIKANGFAVVPVEPTEAMIEAGVNEMRDPSGLVRAYRAMLTAAQEPNAPGCITGA